MDCKTDWTIQIIYAVAHYVDDDHEYGHSGWAIREWFTDKLDATIACKVLYPSWCYVREYKAVRNEGTGEYYQLGSELYPHTLEASRFAKYFEEQEQRRLVNKLVGLLYK